MEGSLVLLTLAGILIGARFSGRISAWLGLPSVFGELLFGLMLGPAGLGWLHPTELLKTIAELGVIVLMFIAGLETDWHELRRVGPTSFWAAVGGVVLPFVTALVLGRAFNLTEAQALFLGATLTATSVSISAQTLRELGQLQGRVGMTVLGAAVIDDVLGMVVLALITGLIGLGSPLLAVLKMAAFCGLAFLFGRRLINSMARWIARHHPGESGLALVMALVLMASWAAQEFGGLAAITGAYLMGIMIAQTQLKPQVTAGTLALGYGLLVPVFFVTVGLEAQVPALGMLSAFIALLTVLAVVTKIVGCGLGAWLSGCLPTESLRIGAGMVARGEVALVMATLGLKMGLLNPTLYTAIVVMTLATTLVTPVLLKMTFVVPYQRPAEPAVEA
ncbi:MAG TPA: cation:proton antiporter [Thermoflexus sp.]|nr:cation:proton antiporter [Thermoflexus sp.]